MKPKVLIGSLIVLQALILVSAQGQTTLTGVYTTAQAARGQLIYTASCASCHGDDLSGAGQAPALAGKDFNTDWVDLSVNDVFERTRISMPADKPGTLTPAQTADVVAFLLSKGGFPAGTAELPPSAATLKAIKFVAPQ